MLFPLKLAFRLIRMFKTIIVSVLAGMGIALFLQLRGQQRTWGIVPGDADRPLPGDDIVAAPDVHDTRTLIVDAPPSAVWPWLAQLGWGRGGWYSYDKFDMGRPSADTVLEEFQDLAVGDIVPTHPGGGFVAKVVEPEKALVLYLDTALVKDQGGDAAAGATDAVRQGADESTPVGLEFAGAMGDMTMPEFRASWAFVLEPENDGRTRLIERFRVWTADAGLPQKLGLPFMGMGVFAMTRRHMLGIQERAEGLARERVDETGPHTEPAEG